MFGYIYLAILLSFWLLIVVADIAAIRWSCASVPRRFIPAMVISFLALVVSYFGAARHYFSSTTTVNGVVTWRFDTRWLFTGSLMLSVGAILLALWRKRKSRHVA
jgi:hypothetical protein